ncbi:MAG: enoyl-CoA hydratase [Acidobacteriota bacterium]|jgi:enoyl-CoA hydratase|nr:enoyl-CoA hydratase [Acidobacteriota bacterium]
MIDRTTTGPITTLRLAHGKVSAFDHALCEALALAVAEVAASDARALIITGTGSSFSAGVDLHAVLDGGAEYVERFYPSMVKMFLELFAFPKPLVVAVNGHAIAGGCIVTLAADYRIMAAGTARIGMPEMPVGVPFPPSIIEAVRFAVPPQFLQSLLYMGRTVLPDEALHVGLIDEVAPAETLADRALAVATQLANLSEGAFALTKRQLRDHALDRARRYNSEFGDDTLALWRAPETHARIRDYLARTIRRK